MTAGPPTAPEFQPLEEEWGVGSPFLQVVRLTVSFLQGLHAQCPSGAYRWEPEGPDSTGEIYIGSDNPIDSKSVGQRPAITVLRGVGAFQGVGMNDLAYVDLRTGAMVKMDILPMTLMVNVLSRFPYEAEQLGWFEMRHMWSLRHVMQKNQRGIMFIGQRPTISPPTPAGSLISQDTEHNWTVVTVSMPVYLQYSSTSEELNKPVLRKVSVSGVAQGPLPKKKPAVALQGSAVMQPKATASVTLTDPADIEPTLPQTGEDGGESTEPVPFQIVVDKE